MNRAWIPAGALASVSVAGLIALGPLTDSLGTTVSFPQSVQVNTGASTVRASVPMSVNVKVVGSTETAALKVRGGAAADVTSTPTAGEAGYVAYKKQHAVTARAAITPAKPAVKPATKPPKRQQTVSATGETNGDNGLASEGQGRQGNGETSSKLAP